MIRAGTIRAGTILVRVTLVVTHRASIDGLLLGVKLRVLILVSDVVGRVSDPSPQRA
ncbi:MAG: hypothetical protein ACP5HZ_12020 [Ferrimicrobium sp.]